MSIIDPSRDVFVVHKPTGKRKIARIERRESKRSVLGIQEDWITLVVEGASGLFMAFDNNQPWPDDFVDYYFVQDTVELSETAAIPSGPKAPPQPYVGKHEKALGEYNDRVLLEQLAIHAPPCPEWYDLHVHELEEARAARWPWAYAKMVLEARPK